MSSLAGDTQAKNNLLVGPQDAGLFDKYDPRVYVGHKAINDYSKDIYDISATTQNLQRITFNTTKNCDHFANWWFCFTVLLTTVGGTYKRLCDGFGFFFINRVELKIGTNTIHTIYPSQETYARYLKYLDTEKQAKLFPQVGLGFSEAERNTLASGTKTQNFYVPLDFWWYDDITKQPIVTGIQQGMTVEVYLNDATMCVETDGTIPAAPLNMIGLTNVSLRTELVIVPEAMRALKVRSVIDGQINYFFKEMIQLPPVSIPSGTTVSQPIKLDGFNGPWFEMFITVRKTADITTNYAMKWTNLSETINFNSAEMRSNQTTIMRPYDIQGFLKPWTDARCYTGPPCPITFFVPSEDPMAPLVATGHMNFQFASNPTLTFTWLTATPEAYTLTIQGRIYNWIQHEGGSIRRLFSP